MFTSLSMGWIGVSSLYVSYLALLERSPAFPVRTAVVFDIPATLPGMEELVVVFLVLPVDE